MLTLYKYRLLSFAVAHKLRRRNSCIYSHEKKYLVAKEIGISVNTYSKYLQECLRLDLVVKSGKTYQFRKLSQIVYNLFGEENKADWKHTRFFAGIDYADHKYKTILERIKFAVADCNFKRQEYRIEGIKKTVTLLQNRFITHKEMTRLKRLAKRFGCEISELPGICKGNNLFIKTGKTHLSNIMGCCASSASNLLKKWAKFQFCIRKKVVKVFDLPLVHSTYDYLLSLGYCRPYIHEGRWKVCLGSRIERMSK